MLFFCLYKQIKGNPQESLKSTFVSNYEEYNSFVTNNSKNIIWAKLIDSQTGETYDSFTNLQYVTLENFNVSIPPEHLKYFSNSCLCLKREFKNLLDFAMKHKEKISSDKSLFDIPYIELKKDENLEQFIPEDVILLNPTFIENIVNEIKFSLNEEELQELKRYEPNTVNLHSA